MPLGDARGRRPRRRSRSAGVDPDQRADVERADRRVQAPVGAHVDRLRSPPRRRRAATRRAASGLAGEREDGAAVIGVGVAVEQRRAARRRPLRGARVRPRRGPRRRWGPRAGRHAQTSSSPPRDERLAVDLDRRLEDDDVEVDRDLDRAADRGRGAEGDVGGAEDLLVLEDVAGQDRLFVGADAELGDVGAVVAVGGEQLHQRLALLSVGVDQVAVVRRSARPGALEPADAGDRAVDDERPLGRALDRRDEPLAAGQVAEGAAVR